MEMTGRMESVENLSEQRRGFASQRQVSHPFHRPLEIARAIPTFPQPRRRYSLTDLQTTKPRGHFYWATEGDISIGLRQGRIFTLDKNRGCGYPNLYPGDRDRPS